VIRRAINRMHAAWLRWVLKCNDAWMQRCARQGITDTESMREWARQADATRSEIDRLEAGL
jgi:hypothetical protein